MKKYLKGIYKSEINFNSYRKGVGFFILIWRQVVTYVKVLGEWLITQNYAKIGNDWKPVVTYVKKEI